MASRSGERLGTRFSPRASGERSCALMPISDSDLQTSRDNWVLFSAKGAGVGVGGGVGGGGEGWPFIRGSMQGVVGSAWGWRYLVL